MTSHSGANCHISLNDFEIPYSGSANVLCKIHLTSVMSEANIVTIVEKDTLKSFTSHHCV